MTALGLYTYYRSSASYRVRIALALKGLSYESHCVFLPHNEQYDPAYVAINPQARVPALQSPAGLIIQSSAIIEYLDEVHPDPPLLPADPGLKARVRSVCSLIACDVQPLNNAGVLSVMRERFDMTEEQKLGWIAHWTRKGLTVVETLIGDSGYCFGSRPGMADVFLIPQLYSARRFGVPVDDLVRLCRVEVLCAAHEPFHAAAPDSQPDAVTPGEIRP